MFMYNFCICIINSTCYKIKKKIPDIYHTFPENTRCLTRFGWTSKAFVLTYANALTDWATAVVSNTLNIFFIAK